MTLGEKQEKFTEMIVELIQWALSAGYKIRVGHFFRCENCNTGLGKSLHKLKLAADLNLFKDGRYLSSIADHLPLGEKWESMGGSWGGRFSDGNHYSLAHEGRR